MKSGYIKYATGLSLDLLAEAWGIYREDKETDEYLRARIVQTIAYHDSSITRESLCELIAILFNISSNDVDLVEREDIPDYSWGATEEGVLADVPDRIGNLDLAKTNAPTERKRGNLSHRLRQGHALQ